MFQELRENKKLQTVFGWLGLFGSLGTLLCCAIPSMLVLLGFGATLASFLGNFPELIWLSENKGMVFTLSFLMLGLSYLGQKFSETQACPIDKREDCERAKNWSKPIFWVSVLINGIGVFYAFILPKILS
jgi:hypothetical protein